MNRRLTRVALGGLLVLAPAAARAQGHPCVYEGSEYSDGAISCQHGAQVQCMKGRWVDQAQTCVGAYGGAAGRMKRDSGAERAVPTGAFMPGDSQVARPVPDGQ